VNPEKNLLARDAKNSFENSVRSQMVCNAIFVDLKVTEKIQLKISVWWLYSFR